MEECKQVHHFIEIHLVTCRFGCVSCIGQNFQLTLEGHLLNSVRFRGDRYILPFVAPRPSAFCPLLFFLKTNSGSVTDISCSHLI